MKALTILLALALGLAACTATPLKNVRSAAPEQTSPDPFANAGKRGPTTGVFTDQAGGSIKQQ